MKCSLNYRLPRAKVKLRVVLLIQLEVPDLQAIKLKKYRGISHMREKLRVDSQLYLCS